MKNFKKVLAFVLAFTMVMSSMTFAFAAESKYGEAADKLVNLGLVNDGSYEADTDFTAVVVMLGRAFGWDTDSAADYELKFTDVPAWAAPEVKYAVKNGILNGVSETEMGQEADVRRVSAFILKVLGEEDFWTNTAELALERGIVEASDLAKFDKQATRGDLFFQFSKALTNKKVGETKTLVEKLVADGKVTEEAAVAAGMITVKPDVFEVVDVQPLGLGQTQITFSHEVKAKKLGEITVNGKATTEVISKEDPTVVIANHTSATDIVKNNKTVKVVVKDTQDVDGTKIARTTKEVAYFDQTIPVLEDVQVVGEKDIKLIFSEAMKNTEPGYSLRDKIELKKGKVKMSISTSSKVDANDPREVLIKTGSKLIDGVEYALTVKGLEDLAGYGYQAVSPEMITVAMNKEKPEIVEVTEVKSDYVKFKFSKNLKYYTSTSVPDDKIYHTNTANDATAATVSGMYLEVKFKNKPFPKNGNYAYVTIAKDFLTDLYGVKNDAMTYEVYYEKDETAPEVEKIEQNDTSKYQIKVTFTEDVDTDSAKDKDHYTITDKDGKDIRVLSATPSGKTVIVKSAKKLSGETTLAIEGVKDVALNEMESYEGVVTVNDKDPISITVQQLDSDSDMVKVRVIFNKEMLTEGKYAITDLAKYDLTYNTSSDHKTFNLDNDDVTYDLSENNKEIVLYVPRSVIRDKFEDQTLLIDDATDSVDLSIARVEDIFGVRTNLIAKQNESATPAGTIGMDLTKVKAVAKDTIEVTYTDSIDSIEPSDFMLQKAGTSGSTIQYLTADKFLADIYKKADNDKVLVIKLNEEQYLEKRNSDNIGWDEFVTRKLKIVSTPETANRLGITIAGGEEPVVADKIKPELNTKATTNSAMTFNSGNVAGKEAEIKLTFTDTLKAGMNANALATDFVISNGSKTFSAFTDYTVTVDHTNKTVTINLISPDVYDTKTGEIKDGTYEVTVSDANILRDKNNNLAEDFSITFDYEN